jgi:hypothetical protein
MPKISYSLIQKLAWLYAIGFVAIAALSYIPALKDQSGNLFGLFSLQLHDDLLHLGSAVWAAMAAYKSDKASRNYFKIFGVLYGLDGVLGLITGSGYLDLGIINNGILQLSITTKILTNIPHIIIGGSAALIGFMLFKPNLKK